MQQQVEPIGVQPEPAKCAGLGERRRFEAEEAVGDEGGRAAEQREGLEALRVVVAGVQEDEGLAGGQPSGPALLGADEAELGPLAEGGRGAVEDLAEELRLEMRREG